MSGSRRVRAALVVICALLAAGCGAARTPEREPVGSTGPALLSLWVYGPPQVITAYAQIASTFSAAHPGVAINVRSFSSSAAAREAFEGLRSDARRPDVFLTSSGDLPSLVLEKSIRQVDDLLGDREVDFGDGFQRSALEAFSAEDRLQCMPVDISPLVVYYNTDLVKLSALTEPGRTPVDAATGWNLAQFEAAARAASRSGTRGVYVAPTLEQVAPFLLSGGGSLVDDVESPTTLRFSSGSTESALEKLLEVVRDPSVTFGESEITEKSALERFEAGTLGMILGFRSLTPQLRATPGLHFDVMPLPRVGDQETVGRSSALCLRATSPYLDLAADFAAYAVSDEASTVLAETGFVVPTNLDVAHSSAFLQIGRDPQSAEVFSTNARYIRPMPTVPTWPRVEAMATPLLTGLFYDPVIEPLGFRLQALDNGSTQILAPTPTPTADPGS